MKMESEPNRGFHRILSRLDDTTRNRYCAEALEEDLGDVLQKFQQCLQAMDHAKQVDEATKSLIANATTPISISSRAVAQYLSELSDLHATFQQSIRTLTGSAQPQIQSQQHHVSQTEARPENPEEAKLLDKLYVLLTKQRRSSWLNDALETARAVLHAMLPSTADAAPAVPDAAFSPDETRIYETFKLLRKSLQENAATHADQFPAFRKMLKKLARKRPNLAVFAERSEVILTAKEQRLADKQAKENPVEPGSSSKSKKRRLSETSASGDASTSRKEPSEATPIVRSTSRKCATQVKALGDLFTMEAYDNCLMAMIEIVNALSPQLSGDEIELVSDALFRLVEKAQKIKDPARRLERLVCLEGLLSVLVRSEGLVWDKTRTKDKAHEYLTNCLYLIEALRSQNVVAPSASTSSIVARPAASRTKQKATSSAPTIQKKKCGHMRFD